MLFGIGKRKKENQSLHSVSIKFSDRFKSIFTKKLPKKEFFAQLEESLIQSDVGVDVTLRLLEKFDAHLTQQQLHDASQFESAFHDYLSDIVIEKSFELRSDRVNVILVYGVNGVGKTTSIGKLAYLYKQQDKKVALAACDTFRAAAIEQLGIWSDRVGIPIIKHKIEADPGAVLYDALDFSIAKKLDVLIVDTAGRMHTKHNLMKELEKLMKILTKKEDQIQHHQLMVLDCTTGQNAMQQAETFSQAAPVDGVILSKMDSTSNGGMVIALSEKLALPVQFIGVGEGIDKLLPFNKEDYLSWLLNKDEN